MEPNSISLYDLYETVCNRLLTIFHSNGTYSSVYYKNLSKSYPVIAAFLETYLGVKLDEEAVAFGSVAVSDIKIFFVLFKDEEAADTCPITSATMLNSSPAIIINMNKMVADDRSVGTFKAVWFTFHLLFSTCFPIHPAMLARMGNDNSDYNFYSNQMDEMVKAIDPIAIFCTYAALHHAGIDDIDDETVAMQFIRPKLMYNSSLSIGWFVDCEAMVADIKKDAIKNTAPVVVQEYLWVQKPLDIAEQHCSKALQIHYERHGEPKPEM